MIRQKFQTERYIAYQNNTIANFFKKMDTLVYFFSVEIMNNILFTSRHSAGFQERK